MGTSPLHRGYQDCYRLLTWDFTCFFFLFFSFFFSPSFSYCAQRDGTISYGTNICSFKRGWKISYLSFKSHSSIFFFFSINACIYTQDQRKENLKKVKKLFHLDGINIFFPFDELTNVITLSLSFFLSRLKSNISYVFLKEKGNIIHSSCLEKFIIASFKTVRDNEYY